MKKSKFLQLKEAASILALLITAATSPAQAIGKAFDCGNSYTKAAVEIFKNEDRGQSTVSFYNLRIGDFTFWGGSYELFSTGKVTDKSFDVKVSYAVGTPKQEPIGRIVGKLVGDQWFLSLTLLDKTGTKLLPHTKTDMGCVRKYY